MKKVLVLLLLMVSTSVFAEWTPVDGSKDGDMTVYIDFGTIKRKGNKVKMWKLYDFKTVKKLAVKKLGENDRYLSGVFYTEYDCEEETGRMLDLYLYSGNMRQGDIVYSHKNIKEEAESIIPQSIEESLFKIACDKK